METVIEKYKQLLDLISEEERQINNCLQGELLEKYKKNLSIEREKIEQQINKLIFY